jgi:hypothetical protein
MITKDAQRDLFRFIFRKQIKSKSTQNITYVVNEFGSPFFIAFLEESSKS